MHIICDLTKYAQPFPLLFSTKFKLHYVYCNKIKTLVLFYVILFKNRLICVNVYTE